MKLLASSILLGAATTALAQQQVLQKPLKQDVWSKPVDSIKEAVHDMTAEAKQVWDEVAMLFPEAMEKANIFSAPKPHTRKPDSKWDYVVKGADVQSVWIENAKGEKEREVDGRLESYNLRAKKVDPVKLGVDTVKQYSGYLDDEENDKHLFYCRWTHIHPASGY